MWVYIVLKVTAMVALEIIRLSIGETLIIIEKSTLRKTLVYSDASGFAPNVVNLCLVGRKCK